MQMFIETITFRKILEWAHKVWAKSFPAVLMLCVGLWIGNMNAESRIVSDCKFAGSFRVEIQAFTCQRKI